MRPERALIVGGAIHSVASFTISCGKMENTCVVSLATKEGEHKTPRTFRIEVEILRPNWEADLSTDANSFSVRWPVVAEMGTIC